MSDEIQRIISGESQVRFGKNIRTAIGYLRDSEKTSSLAKADKHFKEETKRLTDFNKFATTIISTPSLASFSKICTMKMYSQIMDCYILLIQFSI